MEKPSISSSFRNIDASQEADNLVRYLDAIDALPLFRGMKERSYALLGLGEGFRVLDAGCGPGYDAVRMARMVGTRGSVTGVDLSSRMVTLALERSASLNLPLAFQTGDITRLDFPDASFDAVRVERTLQVIREPQRAVAEFVRVLRPSGRIVAMEPDWGTFAFDPGARETVNAFLRFCAAQFADGWTGRRLYRYFRAGGLRDVVIHPELIVVHDLATVSLILMLERFLCDAVAQGVIPRADADAWRSELQEADAKGVFTFTGTIFVASGRK
jgi:ubiquinone/menaquinone biosynthesis C-methylase UbiE